jgi:uncharacterized protein with HEPN domain
VRSRRLADVIEAADAIEAFIYGVEREDFLDNDLLRSAVLQKLSIIGEAAARLPEDFRKRHPEIEWRDIADFRNIAVHAYFAVEWSIVWVAATQETPALRMQVAQIVSEEYPS